MPKGRVVIDEGRCKSCTLCVTACLPGLLRLAGERLNARGYHPAELFDPQGRCTGCGLCAVMCPEACVSVFRARGRV